MEQRRTIALIAKFNSLNNVVKRHYPQVYLAEKEKMPGAVHIDITRQLLIDFRQDGRWTEWVLKIEAS